MGTGFSIAARRLPRWARPVLAVPIVSLVAAALALLSAMARAGDYDAAVDAAHGGDYVAALAEFRVLAKHGDPRGENGLGVLYANGLGVPRDDDLAVEWYRKAANQGYRAAQNNLGEMYLQGRGVERDYATAKYWFTEAASRGDSDAQKNLGLIYYEGWGTPQDPGEAMKWFERAAKHGNAAAQANLAHLFRTGDGVPRNYVMAYAWYGVSAAGGHPMAPQYRDSVAVFLTPRELEDARRLARDLYTEYGSR